MTMKKEVPLNTLTPGERGTVHRVDRAAGPMRQRLMEMGMVRGTPVELVRFAPLGDPIEIRVRGYRLSLRRLDAQTVLVVKEPQ
jgi:ferrous iron transport protein A